LLDVICHLFGIDLMTSICW